MTNLLPTEVGPSDRYDLALLDHNKVECPSCQSEFLINDESVRHHKMGARLLQSKHRISLTDRHLLREAPITWVIKRSFKTAHG